MKRLGGWWRLWIAVSVPLFVGGAISEWPSAPDEQVAAAGEMIRRAKADAEIASTRKGTTWELEGPDGKTYQVIAPPHFVAADIEGYARRQLRNGEPASPDQIKQELAALETELKQLQSEHRSEVGRAIALALIFPGLLLSFGLTFAWVRRGFQANNDRNVGPF